MYLTGSHSNTSHPASTNYKRKSKIIMLIKITAIRSAIGNCGWSYLTLQAIKPFVHVYYNRPQVCFPRSPLNPSRPSNFSLCILSISFYIQFHKERSIEWHRSSCEFRVLEIKMNFYIFHGFFTLTIMVLSIYQIEGKKKLLLKD